MGLYEVITIVVIIFNAGGLVYAFKFHISSLKRGLKHVNEEMKELTAEVAGVKTGLTEVKVDIARIEGRMNEHLRTKPQP